jgi:hypothetical protein
MKRNSEVLAEIFFLALAVSTVPLTIVVGILLLVK